MKSRTRCVLSHDPRVCVTHFLDRISREAHQVWIPLFRSRILLRDALAHLDQRLLNVPRLLGIVEIFAELPIGEMTAKPSVPPEQEWHQANEPRGQEEKKLLHARHTALSRVSGVGRRR